MLDGEVTACLVTRNVLYVAIRGQGVRRLALGFAPRLDATAFWRNARTEAAVPTTIVGLAASEFRSIGRADFVYAVAGDGAIYRFLDDGFPDQRIEMAPPGADRR